MKLKQYLYTQLTITFIPIFMGLFCITSIIFLVKIASLTSVITMQFYELFILFSYSLSSIIFYTLPISFFISLALCLSKLSNEYELIVITSFGLDPKKILKIFLPLTLWCTLLLLIISLGLIPKTNYLTSSFLYKKQKEANFNIKASQYGQKFGDWLLYIKNKDDNAYENITLFKTTINSDQFILAQSAKLNNEEGNFNFILNDGKSFLIQKDKIHQIDFFRMDINDTLTHGNKPYFKHSYDYWERQIINNKSMSKFVFFILISIFPLISLFFMLSFSYYNPRYEKSKAVMYSVGSVVFYYVVSDVLSKKIVFDALYMLPPLWFLFSYVSYKKSIAEVY